MCVCVCEGVTIQVNLRHCVFPLASGAGAPRRPAQEPGSVGRAAGVRAGVWVDGWACRRSVHPVTGGANFIWMIPPSEPPESAEEADIRAPPSA